MKTTGFTNWVHLVYLANLFWSPVFDPTADWLDWLLAGGIIVGFVPLYGMATRRPARARQWFTIPVTLLGAATTPFNSGAAVLFVYAAAFAGVTETRRNAMRWFVGLTVLLSLFSVLSFVPMPWRLFGLVPSLIFLWLVGTLQVEWAERERAETDLRITSARIEHLATVAERERIARDLHDVLGQSLTAIVMRAQLVGELVESAPERARAEAAEVERTARAALTEVRDAVSGWRQASLDAELASARTALEGAGVDLVVSWDDELTITASAEHELALALREAVTNVARHAGASTCRVSLETRDDEVRLVVADDGVGGDPRAGTGLTGLRERIAALGGRVVHRGSPGTTLTIALPAKVAS